MGVRRWARVGLQRLSISVVKFVTRSQRFRDEHNEFVL